MDVLCFHAFATISDENSRVVGVNVGVSLSGRTRAACHIRMDAFRCDVELHGITCGVV